MDGRRLGSQDRQQQAQTDPPFHGQLKRPPHFVVSAVMTSTAGMNEGPDVNDGVGTDQPLGSLSWLGSSKT
jgi:hypothetical protein